NGWIRNNLLPNDWLPGFVRLSFLSDHVPGSSECLSLRTPLVRWNEAVLRYREQHPFLVSHFPLHLDQTLHLTDQYTISFRILLHILESTVHFYNRKQNE